LSNKPGDMDDNRVSVFQTFDLNKVSDKSLFAIEDNRFSFYIPSGSPPKHAAMFHHPQRPVQIKQIAIPKLDLQLKENSEPNLYIDTPRYMQNTSSSAVTPKTPVVGITTPREQTPVAPPNNGVHSPAVSTTPKSSLPKPKVLNPTSTASASTTSAIPVFKKPEPQKKITSSSKTNPTQNSTASQPPVASSTPSNQQLKKTSSTPMKKLSDIPKASVSKLNPQPTKVSSIKTSEESSSLEAQIKSLEARVKSLEDVVQEQKLVQEKSEQTMSKLLQQMQEILAQRP